MAWVTRLRQGHTTVLSKRIRARLEGGSWLHSGMSYTIFYHNDNKVYCIVSYVHAAAPSAPRPMELAPAIRHVVPDAVGTLGIVGTASGSHGLGCYFDDVSPIHFQDFHGFSGCPTVLVGGWFLGGCCASTSVVDHHIPYSIFSPFCGANHPCSYKSMSRNIQIVSNLKFEVLGDVLTNFVL